MLKKTTSLTMALVTTCAMSLATVQSAEARGGRNLGFGIAAGIIGLGVLGSYAYGRDRNYSRACYPGPERCGWSDRHCFVNRYGDEVCRGGHYSCYRQTVCD